MVSKNEQVTTKGLDRKWLMFFVATLLIVAGTFVVQRFLFAPSTIETRGQGGQQETPTPR
jgi:phosphotransferase system  glucose/maltose/N-acetylglucosamine-specific IIC component